MCPWVVASLFAPLKHGWWKESEHAQDYNEKDEKKNANLLDVKFIAY